MTLSHLSRQQLVWLLARAESAQHFAKAGGTGRDGLWRKVANRVRVVLASRITVKVYSFEGRLLGTVERAPLGTPGAEQVEIAGRNRYLDEGDSVRLMPGHSVPSDLKPAKE